MLKKGIIMGRVGTNNKNSQLGIERKGFEYIILADSFDEASEIAAWIETRMYARGVTISGIGHFNKFIKVLGGSIINPGVWFIKLRATMSMDILKVLEQTGFTILFLDMLQDTGFIESLRDIPVRPKLGKVYNTKSFDLYIYTCHKVLIKNRYRILTSINQINDGDVDIRDT